MKGDVLKVLQKILSKIINKFYRLYIIVFEKKFYDGDKRIKYMFVRKKSKKLVVVFSGFASRKNNPTYNMVKTLNGVKINKLFILDDFGYEKKGSYYLGENGEFFVPKLVSDLINEIKKNQNIEEIFCVGSSKGGSAAIYFGLKHNVDHIIAGAPQYFIGNYLSSNDTLLKSLYSITGNTDEKSISLLNRVIRDEIVDYTGEYKPKITIHYSKNEHTYSNHVSFLLTDLKKFGFSVDEDIQKYSDHADVAMYFPTLCKNILKERCE